MREKAFQHVKIWLSLFMTFFMLGVAFAPSFHFLKTADAGFFRKSSFDRVISNPAPLNLSRAIRRGDGSRKYTIQELFGPTLFYTEFYGNTEENPKDPAVHWFLRAKDSGFSDERANALGHDVLHNLFSPINQSFLPSLVMRMNSLFVEFISTVSSSVFNQSLICSDPDNPKKDAPCFNLLKLVGGKRQGSIDSTYYDPYTHRTEKSLPNSTGGLIRRLTNGFFFPLLVFAVAISGIYIAYIGIARREYHTAINMFLWILVVLLLGAFFTVKPYLIANFPRTVTNTFSYCLIAGINGESCFNSSSSGEGATNFISHACRSWSDKSTGLNRTEYIMNGLNCSIWTSFVLNPWAQGMFGTHYKNLDNIAPFSVALRSESNPDDLNGSFYRAGLLSGEEENNLALSWLSVMTGNGLEDIHTEELVATDEKTPSSEESSDNMSDSEVKNKIDYITAAKQKIPPQALQVLSTVAEQDPSMWNAFVGKSDRFGSMLISLISVLILAIVTVKFAIKAHIYSFLSVMLLAFGPVFLLFGVHYGRGRKIFLGWVESVIGYTLKFMAMAILLLFTMILYSVALEQVVGLGALMVSAIIAFSMNMYKNEFVEMIAEIDLGGERFSSSMVAKTSALMNSYVTKPLAAWTGTVAWNLRNRRKRKKYEKKTGEKYGVFKGASTAMKETRRRERTRKSSFFKYKYKEEQQQAHEKEHREELNRRVFTAKDINRADMDSFFEGIKDNLNADREDLEQIKDSYDKAKKKEDEQKG